MGTVICTNSPNVEIFILARIIQGIGEGNAEISDAIVRDIYDDPNERAYMMSIF